MSDLRHSGQWSVRRHDGQGEAAALVPEDGGRLPGHPLRQLHHQLEGRQTLQRRHTQELVSVASSFFDTSLSYILMSIECSEAGVELLSLTQTNIYFYSIKLHLNNGKTIGSMLL